MAGRGYVDTFDDATMLWWFSELIRICNVSPSSFSTGKNRAAIIAVIPGREKIVSQVKTIQAGTLVNLMRKAPVELKSFGHGKTHRSVLRVKMMMDYGTLLLGAKTPAEVLESSAPSHVQKSRLSDKCTLEIWVFYLRQGGCHSNTTPCTWPVFFFFLSPHLHSVEMVLNSLVCVIMMHQQRNILLNSGIKICRMNQSKIPVGEKAQGQLY